MRPQFDSWIGRILCRRDRLSTLVSLGFPCGSAGKDSASNAEDLGLTPGLGRSLEEGNGYPLQCSGMENSMVCIVHGVTKSWTRLSNFHLIGHRHATDFCRLISALKLYWIHLLVVNGFRFGYNFKLKITRNKMTIEGEFGGAYVSNKKDKHFCLYLFQSCFSQLTL